MDEKLCSFYFQTHIGYDKGNPIKAPTLVCSICKETVDPSKSFQAHVENCKGIDCKICGVCLKRQCVKFHFETIELEKSIEHIKLSIKFMLVNISVFLFYTSVVICVSFFPFCAVFI